MTIARKGIIKFGDADVTIIGADLKPGDVAPEFVVHDNDWKLVKVLESTKGKVRIIVSLLSLNTSVCDRETHRFNQEAAALGEDIAIIVVSMDLPFTQENWCGAAGVDRVITVSDHLLADFGEKYGLLIEELRILRRAVFVVDRNDKIAYVDYMPALGEEPDYEKVLIEARKAF